MRRRAWLIGCHLVGVAVSLVWADPGRYYRQARLAERQGQWVRAYLLYAQAAAENPNYRDAWIRSQVLRRRALSALQVDSVAASLSSTLGNDRASSSQQPDGEGERIGGVLGRITAEEWVEASRLASPVRLRAADTRRSWDLRGDARQLYEQICRAYDLEVIFDSEFQGKRDVRFRISDADYRQALTALQAATATFVIPVSEHLVLVADDTPQKRQQLEPVGAVLIPLPDTISTQEVQELAQAVQQVMEIGRLVVDTQRQMVLIRDRVSKVEIAAELFRSLLGERGEVVLEVELVELLEARTARYGVRWPEALPVVWLSRIYNSTPQIPSGISGLLSFGAGRSWLALGVTDAELFASMIQTSGRTLIRSLLRAAHRQPATLHVGDKYPVQIVGYFGPVEKEGPVYAPPPTISFEELGFVLKLTPYVHSATEVTLEVEAQYKLLAGLSLNGIPVIANRTVQGTVRLREGEWAILAGLVEESQTESLAGIAGLSEVLVLGPLFRRKSRTERRGITMVVLKPWIVRPPLASQKVGGALLTGTETRTYLPL